MYQHFPFFGPQKVTQIGIFGLKMNHLATLHQGLSRVKFFAVILVLAPEKSFHWFQICIFQVVSKGPFFKLQRSQRAALGFSKSVTKTKSNSLAYIGALGPC
jgi:hypothetical protein